MSPGGCEKGISDGCEDGACGRPAVATVERIRDGIGGSVGDRWRGCREHAGAASFAGDFVRVSWDGGAFAQLGLGAAPAAVTATGPRGECSECGPDLRKCVHLAAVLGRVK